MDNKASKEAKIKECLKEKFEKEGYKVFINKNLGSTKMISYWKEWFKNQIPPLPQPEIDFLIVDKTTREFKVAEIKYFEIKGREALSQPYYAGIGEALALAKFGFPYIYLWHFFDEKIPLEKIIEYGSNTRDLIAGFELKENQNLGLNLPINFRCFIKPSDKEDKIEEVHIILGKKSLQPITSLIYGQLIPNPLKDWKIAQRVQEFLRKHLSIPAP